MSNGNSAIGKVAELEFNLTALKRGYACLWPSVDIHGYDCVIDCSGKLYKIQIKSSTNVHTNNRGYKEVKFSCSKGRGASIMYDRNDFDFLVCYSHALKIWWIIPMEDTPIAKGSRSLSIYPERTNSKYTKFENAWHLFDE